MKYKIDSYIENITSCHELVSRKLCLAQQQLEKATTIEEYQQIGILLRDSWIEFSRKLYPSTITNESENKTKQNEAKVRLSLALAQWPDITNKIKSLCNELIDLTNEIQHRTSIDVITVGWCLVNTALAISELIEIDCWKKGKISERYYKCPICGSLNLTVEKDIECDWDGPGPEYENWKCEDCDWTHYICPI